MTVQQLIDELKKYPLDKVVYVGEILKEIDVADKIVGITDDDRNYVLIYHAS